MITITHSHKHWTGEGGHVKPTGTCRVSIRASMQTSMLKFDRIHHKIDASGVSAHAA